MESAAGILGVMTQAGLEPSADTYTTLMCGYARKGDIEAINKLLETCDQKDVFLLDKDLLEIVYSLSTNGFSDKVDPVIDKIRKMAGYNQDAVNVILRLINKSQEEVALKILKTMPRGSKSDGELTDTGSFLIKQLVKANRPFDKILRICTELEANKMNSRPLMIALESALVNGVLDVASPLLMEMKKSGYELRQHYFWPLICTAGNKGQSEVLNLVQSMQKDFELTPSGETVREYVIPSLHEKNYDKVLGLLRSSGLSPSTSAVSTAYQALADNNLQKAVEIATSFNVFYSPGLFRRPLLSALSKTKDFDNYIKFIREIFDSIPRMQTLNRKEQEEAQEESEEEVSANQAEILGQIVYDAVVHFKQNREEILLKILNGLVDQGLSISNGQAERIQEKIGESLTPEISTLLGKLTTGDLEPIPLEKKGRTTGIQNMDVHSLENFIRNLEEKGENTKNLKKHLLVTAIRSKDVAKTEEIIGRLEEEGYILTSGVYAQLIDLYSATDNLDKAIETYQKIKVKEPEFVLDDMKTIKMMQLYVDRGNFDETLKFLEENKKVEAKEDNGFNYRATCWRLLNGLAEKGDVENLQKIFDGLVDNNYIVPSNVLLGPLIKVHMVKNDLKSAVDKFEEICQKYRATPWKNELACKLIQGEDANNLQKLTDLSTDIHGEVNSLYDLVFSFVECGRIRQARKILETPGLRTRPQRINSACERYIQEGMTQPLEGLVEATKDLNHIDRAEIYYSLLLNYIKEVEPQKALGLWDQMQEEDIAPNDQFLLKLSEFLKSKNIDVPFVVPEKIQQAKVEKAKVEPVKVSTKTTTSQESRKVREKQTSVVVNENVAAIKNALKSGDVDLLMSLKQKLTPSDKLTLTDQSLIVEVLVKNDRLNEATKMVLEMLGQEIHPIPRIFRFYLNKLAASGDIETLSKIGDKLSSETKKIISFDNRFCHANISAGKSEEYLKNLEKSIDDAVTPEQIKDAGEKFPRGGAVGILDALPECSGKFEEIAVKYAKKGLLGPMNVLWMHHFIKNETEIADRLWKEHLSSAPRLMFQRIVHLGRESQDTDLIQRLINLLKTAKVSEGALGNAYSCLLDIQSNKSDFDSALKSLDEAIKDVCLENINKTALMRIKEGVEKSGKNFPHTIPSKSGNNKNTADSSSSSSSSSSSDDEVTKKKSNSN